MNILRAFTRIFFIKELCHFDHVSKQERSTMIHNLDDVVLDTREITLSLQHGN